VAHHARLAERKLKWAGSGPAFLFCCRIPSPHPLALGCLVHFGRLSAQSVRCKAVHTGWHACSGGLRLMAAKGRRRRQRRRRPQSRNAITAYAHIALQKPQPHYIAAVKASFCSSLRGLHTSRTPRLRVPSACPHAFKQPTDGPASGTSVWLQVSLAARAVRCAHSSPTAKPCPSRSPSATRRAVGSTVAGRQGRWALVSTGRGDGSAGGLPSSACPGCAGQGAKLWECCRPHSSCLICSPCCWKA
jgi:hypothetical protein